MAPIDHPTAGGWRLLCAALNAVEDRILVVDAQRKTLFVNQSFERAMGCRCEDVAGTALDSLTTANRDRGFFASLAKAALSDEDWGGEIISRRDGEAQLVDRVAMIPVSDETGEREHSLIILRGAEGRAAEAHPGSQARYDPLTGLPNRRSLDDRLGLLLDAASWKNKMLAVMLVDLDRFGEANDTLGRGPCDLLLKTIAQRLRGCVRGSDVLARVGGDEFGIVLEGLDSMQGAIRVVRRIQESLAKPVVAKGEEVRLTACIGISLYPTDSREAEVLVAKAEGALSRARNAGRSRFEFSAESTKAA